MKTKIGYIVLSIVALTMILLATWPEDQPQVSPTPTVAIVTPVPISVPMGIDAINAQVAANATAGGPPNCSSASAIMAPVGCKFAPAFPTPVGGNP